MKRFLTILILLLVVNLPSFAYIEKIYNSSGYQIGYARKNGDDYIIYDLNDKEVTDFDAFYNSPGDPNKRKLEVKNC